MPVKRNYIEICEPLLAQIDEPYRGLFRELAEHASTLGYQPKQTKTELLALDFHNSKTNKTILKLELHAGSKVGNAPGIRMKFYAAQELKGIFAESVRQVIEEYDGRYTGCYGCGRCPGKPEGYLYQYPDGRKVFRCGGELISIEGYTREDLPEMKRLLSLQAAYFS